jgi:hypothetical protein
MIRKNTFLNLYLVLIVMILGGCSSKMLFQPYLSNHLVETESQTFFYKDIPYDLKTLTKFDIIIPKSNKSVPLIIFIHGGGFSGGDKSDVYNREKFADEIKLLTARGIAYATINYRLLGTSDNLNIMSCLGDAKRCLQFIRYHAKEFNIDENRIGLYGGSAGAGTCLWLSMSEDMKVNSSSDPMEKKSTRVKAVAAYATQGTYDLYKWDEIFRDYSMSDNDIAKMIGHQKIENIYGMNSISGLNNMEILKLRKKIDLGDLITMDDPPLWIENPLKTNQKPSNVNELYHHYLHGEYLYNKAQKAGINVYVNFPAKPFKSEKYLDVVDFFVKHL